MYVCTANTNLDLSRGVIAQRMSKLAGPSLQKECTDKGGANVGDVVVTGPGNLKCQYVFHAVASNHNYDKDGKVQFNCLCTQVVRGVVTMLYFLCRFFRSYYNSALKNVKIVR